MSGFIEDEPFIFYGSRLRSQVEEIIKKVFHESGGDPMTALAILTLTVEMVKYQAKFNPKIKVFKQGMS